MAQKVMVTLEDDMDGGPAAETVRFGFEGAEYEIDLNSKNAKAFRTALDPFIGHARRAGRGLGRRGRRALSVRQEAGDIRAWARAEGVKVSDRGRIPAAVISQYRAARRQ